MYPRLIALLLIAGSLAAAATGASAPSEPAIVSAGANGLSILVPGQPASVAAEAKAPGPGATGVADGFVFPADGSLVRTGALSSSVSSRATGTVGAQGVSDVLGVTLFNGEVTAESAAARAKATATGADAVGSRLVNLVVFGTPVAATPNLRVALGDWGYLVALEQVADAPVADGTRNARGAVNALHVVLTADHAGLPAGTEILVAHAEAAVSTPVDATTATQPATTTTAKPSRAPGAPAKKPLPKPPEAGVHPNKPGSVFRIPPTDVSAPLSPKGYVFPVYGGSSFATPSEQPGRASSGITARTSSRRSGPHSSPSPTGRSSRSAGTTSAATGSGCVTGRATSSTTPISRRSLRSPWTATR